MFRMSSRGRTVITVLMLDVLCPLVLIGWYSILEAGFPAALFLRYPWLVLTALAFPLALAVADLYNPRASWWSLSAALRACGAALGVVLLFGSAHAFAGNRGELPGLFGALLAAMTAVAFGSRAAVGLRIRSGRTVRRALVVGAGWAGQSVVDCTLFEPRLWIRVVGAVDDDPHKRNSEYKGVPVVGTGADLAEAVARHDVDLVITAIPRAQTTDLATNLVRLALHDVEIVDMPGFVEQVTGQVPLRSVEGAWLVYGTAIDALSHPWRRRFKRAFDATAAAAALVLGLPLLVIISLLVKLTSRGPVFFFLERAGRGDKPLRLVKFRTMKEDGNVGEETKGRSYRLTGVGRLLRRTGLAEIPQLLNVLKGDLSVVGPRPEPTAAAVMLRDAIPPYALRFLVMPGLMGWAQVQHRFGTAVEESLERLKFDLYYIKNMSFRLDLFIILKTLKLVAFPSVR